MNTIHLHGHLSNVGKSFKLNVTTPTQAISLLAAQLKDFRKLLRQGHYHIRLGNTYLDKVTLHANLGQHDLHIIPAIQGTGGGKLPLFVGTALLAIATGGAALIAAPNAVWGTVGLMGVGLMAGGLTQMLSKSPKMPTPQSKPDDNTSQLFSGLANTTTQGVPVTTVALNSKPQGGNALYNNMQPSLGLIFIIKT